MKGQGSFKALLFASIIVVLFAFASLTFMFEFFDNNAVNSTQVDEQGAFSYTEINESLKGVQTEAGRLKNVFVATEEEESGFLEGAFTLSTAFFRLPVQMISFIVDLFDLVVVDGLNYIFQNSAVGVLVTSVIIAIIIFSIIFGILRILKQGD